MRSELQHIKRLDDYLAGNMSAEDKLVLEAEVLVSPAMQRSLCTQEKVHRLVRAYGRDATRAKLEEIHRKLMKNVSFRKLILSFFS